MARAGIGATSGWDSSMITVHAQCGRRSAAMSAEPRRPVDRPDLGLGLEATAVASKVGSSMSWHIERT